MSIYGHVVSFLIFTPYVGSAQPQSCARYPPPMLAVLASVIVLTSLSVPRVQLTTNSDSTVKLTIEKCAKANIFNELKQTIEKATKHTVFGSKY